LADKAFPDGISEKHLKTGSPFPLRFRWAMLFALGAVLTLALLGVFGGLKNDVVTASGPDATLEVNTPAILRSGQIYEMRVVAGAKRPIAKPAIAVAESYWRDLTINTLTPTPANESFEDGYFVFEFDPLEAGESIGFKIDGSVNPSLLGGTRGAVEFRDDKRPLAKAGVKLRVYP